jgi:hypothetical protein
MSEVPRSFVSLTFEVLPLLKAWQEDCHPWAPESPAPESANAHARCVIESMRALGIMKPSEQARTLHQHGCPYPKNFSAACSCIDGPEIIWADHDEITPARHYTIPERFHAGH